MTDPRGAFRHRAAGPLLARAAVAAMAIVADGLVHAVAAQSPFGAPRPASSEPQASGLIGWVLDMQARFYRQISTTLRAASTVEN